MSERTLIKVSAGEHCIGFRTVSRKKKSPWEFLVCRSELEKLERDGAVIAQDIHGFAVLSRNIPAGTLHMEFTWLCGGGNEVTGYKEDMVIRYDEWEFENCEKLERIKLFKNGRMDLRFTNEGYARQFAAEYLGTVW